MFASELIGQLARRIYVGGDTEVRVCIKGELYGIDIDAKAFHATPVGDGGMIAVIPAHDTPSDTLPAEQPREGEVPNAGTDQ